MSLVPLEPYTQISIYILVPFIVGLVLGFKYKKIKNVLPKRHSNANVIRAIVSEYTRRLDGYENAIADLRVRLDLLESSRQKHEIPPQLHSTSKSSVTSGDVSQGKSQSITKEILEEISSPYEVQNETAEYVLKLLKERSMTSRGVQQAIGRSREHSSRLMKKLHEYGLVSRDTNAKPFKYTLTEAGRLRLEEGRYVIGDASSDPTDVSHDSRIESRAK